MPTVNTVLGPVDAAELKFTLMHEHVMVSSAGIPHTFPELIDRDRFVTLSVQALKEAAADGVNTYVDVTTMDLGRDMDVLERVAEQSEVHIIPCTGIWLDIPRAISRITPEELARVFIREIEVGIEGTGIKAGIIKVATSEEGVTPANDIVLRAAAMTCNETGVPISTHTAALAKVGNDQIAIFEEEGVDLSRVYIGHSNDTADLDYLSGIARKGCLLGMDHYPGGRPGGLNWEERTQVVKQLLDMGLADHVTLSHDFSLSYDDSSETEADRATYNPDGICFIPRRVLPRLKELGVTQEQIDAMTVDAPRRYFGGE